MSDTTKGGRVDGRVGANPSAQQAHDTTDTTNTHNTRTHARTHARDTGSADPRVSDVSVVSATPTAQPNPTTALADGCTNHHTTGDSPTNAGASAIDASDRGQSETAAQPAQPAKPVRQGGKPSVRQREAARLSLTMSLPDVAARLDVHTSAVYRWSHTAWWERVRRAALADVLAADATARIVVRAKALAAAETAIDAGAADAAMIRAVLSATVPDGAERDARVRMGLLKRLPPALRTQVAAHLDDGDAAALAAAMTDEELEALAASERKDPR